MKLFLPEKNCGQRARENENRCEDFGAKFEVARFFFCNGAREDILACNIRIYYHIDKNYYSTMMFLQRRQKVSSRRGGGQAQ